ncbi:MAG: mechanosensitive ion channel family protein [Firmicutes bacterium]|nr:mechanosensitive ion channel family protein [Bacillota bacterium]
MNILNRLSELTSIDNKYWILIFKTLVFWLVLDIIKRIIIRVFKRIKNGRKEYEYTQKLKLVISILKLFVFILLWAKYLKGFITIISFISAGFTIALRDVILNMFAGIYIKIVKPFNVEDRIEINNYKGDVVNINAMNFELLEVDNADFMGQSTGVITHVPNSTIFSYPLRNYDKVFKYIWNEITVNIPLDFDIEKVRKTLYRIVNKNDVIDKVPEIVKKDIQDISTDYRIYYSEYTPIVYCKVMGDYVEYTLRYLVDPRKARYVNSSIWKHILLAHQKGEIKLYNKNVEYDMKETKNKK